MPDPNSRDEPRLSRRRLLQLSGGTVGLLGLGSTPAAADGSDYCSETTIRPSTVHYDDSIHEVCADDHPKTQSLQADVRASLTEEYPTVGSLIDAGFLPYFDFFDDGSWSHWLNPAFVGDGSVLDPARPASILVDHTWWRPIGVMFIATANGVSLDPPPTVYAEGSGTDRCTPWHAHVGIPGRYAWWKYKQAYDRSLMQFPCRTPWMMHVWIYPHSESLYAHSAPSERGGPPAEDPGFDTDADPDEVELGPEHLPDAIRDEVADLW